MHQGHAFADRDQLVALVPGAVLEHHDAVAGARLAVAQPEHHGIHMQRIPGEHRLGKTHLVPTQVADRGAQRGVAHRNAHHQPEREHAVHQGLAELGCLGILGIQVDRRRVVRHGAEDDVVGFRHGAPNVVPERLPYFKLLEIKTRHRRLPL